MISGLRAVSVALFGRNVAHRRAWRGKTLYRKDRIMNRILRNTLLATSLATLATYAFAQSAAENPITPPPPHEKQAPAVERNLKVFDTLDFDVFSNQKWDRLHESHAKDSVVTLPDGHETK